MYKCKPCNRRYVPQSRRYSKEMRQLAVEYYADGLSYRKIARHFKVHHVTIMNWVKAFADQLPAAPTPAEKPLHILEMDELHTFVGRKKQMVHNHVGGASEQLHCRFSGQPKA